MHRRQGRARLDKGYLPGRILVGQTNMLVTPIANGAIRLIHAVLGLPPDLTEFGVHKAFIDARSLSDAS